MSTELATMVVDGELEVLDAQGLDPMTCLVMPRIVSAVVSVFCLAVITAFVMIATGYIAGRGVDVIRVPWLKFLEQFLDQFGAQGLIVLHPQKLLLLGGFAAAICCIDGLSVRGYQHRCAARGEPIGNSRVDLRFCHLGNPVDSHLRTHSDIPGARPMNEAATQPDSDSENRKWQ